MKKSKTLFIILLIIFAVVFIAAAAVLIIKYMPDKSYKKYRKEPTSEVSSAQEILEDNPVDFSALKQQNPDVCGYIKIDGTAVDYPILRSGEDKKENFYLDHDWLGNSKFAGAIYVQKVNSEKLDDPCTVLYGHNMLDGSMFAGIRKYQHTDFYNANRYITIYTPGHIFKYEIFSAFTYDDRLILKSFDFNDKADYEYFIEETINPKTMFSHNSSDELKPSFGDKFIVLSTCTDSYGDMRYLVCAKLIEDTKTK